MFSFKSDHLAMSFLGFSFPLSIPRTFNDLEKYKNKTLIKKLKNVLITFTRRNITIGYCQGFNFIIAKFLEIYNENEEEVFWLFCQLIEVIFPSDYYLTLSGVLTDTTILNEIIQMKYPNLEPSLQINYYNSIIIFLTGLFINNAYGGSTVCNFDDLEIATIVDACEEKKFKRNEYIIKQGDNGDNLYIIESGELICEKVFNKGESPTYLKTYKEGELFGELALLYNAPRAATIYAKTDCVLWAIDRLTFNTIIKESAINKREKYKKFLETIPLLSTVKSYEIYSICDAIKMEKFQKNQYIIKEGEEGDKFYILDEGEAVATKKKMNFKKKYSKGDYFGELALLRNAPRAASVMAVTDCKVLSLDRLAFKRLLGPLEDILKRNSEAYEKYTKI